MLATDTAVVYACSGPQMKGIPSRMRAQLSRFGTAGPYKYQFWRGSNPPPYAAVLLGMNAFPRRLKGSMPPIRWLTHFTF